MTKNPNTYYILLSPIWNLVPLFTQIYRINQRRRFRNDEHESDRSNVEHVKSRLQSVGNSNNARPDYPGRMKTKIQGAECIKHRV